MTGGSVSDLDPVSAQVVTPARPQEERRDAPEATAAGSLAPPPEPQAAIRSAYVAHLSQADAGAGEAHDLLAGSMRSAYVSHLSQADAGTGDAHDLPAASMIRAIYAERIAAGTAQREARVARKRKAKASAPPAGRRKRKTVTPAAKRRGKRPRR